MISARKLYMFKACGRGCQEGAWCVAMDLCDRTLCVLRSLYSETRPSKKFVLPPNPNIDIQLYGFLAL